MYLEHANITVASIDKAIQFLGTAFPEFQIRGQGQGETRRWLHFGNQQTYIALQQNNINTAAQDSIYVNSGINHLGLVVEDVSSISANLAAKGYVKTDSSVDETYRKRVYFIDDNQVEWEFIEYLSEKHQFKNQY
jgi:hypothetical protein